MADIVALIPARAGSKGVPDKNVRKIGDYPLIDWTIAACLRSRLIERTIVSTDSEAYADMARKAGAEAPFLRPAEISGDTSTDYQFIVHALDWLEDHGQEPKYIVHMRPTTPLRDPSLVDQAITEFTDGGDATALRSVQEMAESAYKTFEISARGHLATVGGSGLAGIDSANEARQQFPKTYYPNGYVDVLSSAYIRQAGRIHGERVIPFITPTTIEVDCQDDFDLLDWRLSRSPEIMTKLFK